MINPELLPPITVEGDFQRVAKNSDLCLQVAQKIFAAHDVRGELYKYDNGSQIVVAAGDDHVLKIFAPIYQANFANESKFLRYLQDRLPIATPKLIAVGECDGYPYIVMSKLPGCLLCEVWRELPRRDKLSICRLLGKTAAVLHALPLPVDITVPWPTWSHFIERQTEKCYTHHKKFGLSETWLAQIPSYLQAVEFPQNPPMVPLHTELMLDHIMVQKDPQGHWQITGLLDFEASGPGHWEYEFAAIGVFITAGDQELLRTFFAGYGCQSIPADLSQRLMAYLLLHRYSNLRWFFTLLPAGVKIDELSELAQFWFAI